MPSITEVVDSKINKIKTYSNNTKKGLLDSILLYYTKNSNNVTRLIKIRQALKELITSIKMDTEVEHTILNIASHYPELATFMISDNVALNNSLAKLAIQNHVWLNDIKADQFDDATIEDLIKSNPSFYLCSPNLIESISTDTIIAVYPLIELLPKDQQEDISKYYLASNPNIPHQIVMRLFKEDAISYSILLFNNPAVDELVKTAFLKAIGTNILANKLTSFEHITPKMLKIIEDDQTLWNLFTKHPNIDSFLVSSIGYSYFSNPKIINNIRIKYLDLIISELSKNKAALPYIIDSLKVTDNTRRIHILTAMLESQNTILIKAAADVIPSMTSFISDNINKSSQNIFRQLIHILASTREVWTNDFITKLLSNLSDITTPLFRYLNTVLSVHGLPNNILRIYTSKFIEKYIATPMMNYIFDYILRTPLSEDLLIRFIKKHQNFEELINNNSVFFLKHQNVTQSVLEALLSIASSEDHYSIIVQNVKLDNISQKYLLSLLDISPIFCLIPGIPKEYVQYYIKKLDENLVIDTLSSDTSESTQEVILDYFISKEPHNDTKTILDNIDLFSTSSNPKILYKAWRLLRPRIQDYVDIVPFIMNKNAPNDLIDNIFKRAEELGLVGNLLEYLIYWPHLKFTDETIIKYLPKNGSYLIKLIQMNNELSPQVLEHIIDKLKSNPKLKLDYTAIAEVLTAHPNLTPELQSKLDRLGVPSLLDNTNKRRLPQLNDPDLYLLATLFIDSNINNIKELKITRPGLANSQIIKDFVRYLNGKNYTLDHIIEFDRLNSSATTVPTSRLTNFIKANLKLKRTVWMSNLQRIFRKKNFVLQFNIAESKVHQLAELLGDSTKDFTKPLNVYRHTIHPISRFDLTVGWVRFTVLSDDSIWIDEVQTDLPKLFDIKNVNNVTAAIMLFMLKEFIKVAHKYYGVTKLYYPTIQVKHQLYKAKPPISVYRDIPRKLRFGPTTTSKEGIIIPRRTSSDYPIWKLEANATMLGRFITKEGLEAWSKTDKVIAQRWRTAIMQFTQDLYNPTIRRRYLLFRTNKKAFTTLFIKDYFVNFDSFDRVEQTKIKNMIAYLQHKIGEKMNPTLNPLLNFKQSSAKPDSVEVTASQNRQTIEDFFAKVVGCKAVGRNFEFTGGAEDIRGVISTIIKTLKQWYKIGINQNTVLFTPKDTFYYPAVAINSTKQQNMIVLNINVQ